MKTEDIIHESKAILHSRRNSLLSAVGDAWQAGCISELQKVTGLGIEPMTQCDCLFPAVDGGPYFAFPTRELWQEAEKIAIAASHRLSKPTELVNYFLRNLPRTNYDDFDLDLLGRYFPEAGVIGGRVELYWARILALTLTPNKIEAEAYAKVIMLHELAHYVTHQGAKDNRHWDHFPSGSDIVEIVAQVATEEVIRRSTDPTLLPAFESLLEKAPLKYRDHRRIVKKLRDEFTSSKGNPAYAEFWYFFSNIIKHSKAPKITSIASVDVGIDWTRALTGGEHGLDLTF
jgi:hypothetical protein